MRQLIHRELFQRSAMSGAGVVDQQVDTPRSVRTEPMHESTDSSLVTSRALSSTPDNSSAIPQRFRRLRMASGCYDLPAGCGQRAGCQPYATARAGDLCNRRHISPISVTGDVAVRCQVGAAGPAGLHGDRTADQLQQVARPLSVSTCSEANRLPVSNA